MALLEMKNVKITEKGQIAIPKRIRELEGFGEGEEIAILAFDDHVELRSSKQVTEKLATAIASEKSLAKDWDTEEEDEAWSNL